MLIFSVALAFFAPAAPAYEFDAALSKELSAEFKKTITGNATGAEVYSRIESSPLPSSGAVEPASEVPQQKGFKNSKLPRILVRYDNSVWLAHFNAAEDTIYFNSRFVMRFFGAKKLKQAQLIERLHKNAKARAEFVKYADALCLHELVHALQSRLYPNYKLDVPADNPVEFEYEAYLTENLYCHEKMKKDPKLLKAFISGSYYDLYTANTLGAYLMLSLDRDDYREKIRKKYEEEIAGYSTFARNVAAQKNTVADSKIIGYASGSVGDYTGKTAALSLLQAEKEAYAAFLKGFYEARWPAFSAEALMFVGSAALEVKNYPLALECLAVADENAGKYGVPPEEFKKLKEKGAVAVLEAAAFIKDYRKKMTLEILSQHLKALEKACKKTGRPFPEIFADLRAEVYPKALKYYARRASAEKDREKKEYYEENTEYFLQALDKAQ